MDDTLLCRCSNSIVADSVTDILKTSGIAFRQHDETTDQRFGAYGPCPGIAIYVFKKDLEKAKELVAPVVDIPAEDALPACPKCGGGNTESIKAKKGGPVMLVVAALLFLLPCLYLIYGKGIGVRSVTMDVIAAVVFAASLALMFSYDRIYVNYRCKDCGRKFRHV